MRGKPEPHWPAPHTFGNTSGHLKNRHHSLETSQPNRQNPGTKPRANPLPTLPPTPSMGHHTPTQQPRSRPHHAMGTRRQQHAAKPTHPLQALQPKTRQSNTTTNAQTSSPKMAGFRNRIRLVKPSGGMPLPTPARCPQGASEISPRPVSAFVLLYS